MPFALLVLPRADPKLLFSAFKTVEDELGVEESATGKVCSLLGARDGVVFQDAVDDFVGWNRRMVRWVSLCRFDFCLRPVPAVMTVHPPNRIVVGREES